MYPIDLFECSLFVKPVGYAGAVGKGIDVPCLRLCAVEIEGKAEMKFQRAFILFAAF